MKYYFLLLSLFSLLIVNGQDIVSFKDKLLVKTSFDKQSESFFIDDSVNTPFIVDANNDFKIRLSANYQVFGLSVALSPNSDSKFRNINLNLFLDHWFQTFEYSNLQGFFKQLSTTNTGNKPQLKKTSWSGSTAYTFNPNFSLKHLISLNEWQRKSAGSFIPTLKYGYTDLYIVTENTSYTQNSLNIALAPSYAYTQVIKNNFFVMLDVAPAIGLRLINEDAANSKTKTAFMTRSLDLKLQFGYTSEKISAGAIFNFDSTQSRKEEQRNFVNDKNFASLYFGYRFDPPEFLKRGSKWIKDTIKL